jgi:hypothetical protein
MPHVPLTINHKPAYLTPVPLFPERVGLIPENASMDLHHVYRGRDDSERGGAGG